MGMNVNLTPQLVELVRSKVASGMYTSASEVVREALRLMDEQDRLRAAKLEQLRDDIRLGLNSGSSQTWSAEDSLDQADRWIDKLDEKFGILATQPLMGRAREELAADLRSFPFGRYVIFYMPVQDGIDVVRVLHSARDVDAAFGEEL